MNRKIRFLVLAFLLIVSSTYAEEIFPVICTDYVCCTDYVWINPQGKRERPPVDKTFSELERSGWTVRCRAFKPVVIRPPDYFR